MSKSASYFLGIALALVSFLTLIGKATASYNLPDPYTWSPLTTPNDTTPLQDRKGNWVDDPVHNPFDLLDPEDVVKDVQYDPTTNTYILTEKVGNENYRSPTQMTYDEYLDWQSKQEEKEYWLKLAGAADGSRSKSGNLDPVAQVDVSKDIIDRLFGGTNVDIRPQGNVDLTFGVDYYRQDNPILPIEQQRNGPQFDFDMDIQVDVNAQIGEKLKTSFNYNTSRTFDFQNKLKLEYNSDLFSEDEILKSIEAGDVSLPLKSTLIQGSQKLFGIKTALQFGHMRITAIASQQNSKQSDIKIQGGSIVQDYQIYADQYDENRHFFLSHYNRDAYETSLKNLPQINTLFHITRLEVWVTNDRNQTTDVRDIVALSDLGESRHMTVDDPAKWQNPDSNALKDLCMKDILPDNNTNFILRDIRNNPDSRYLNKVVNTLQNPPFNFQLQKDFEKVQARRLSASEYRFNPDLGFVSLNIRLDQDEVIGVAYEYTYNGKVYQVGELSQNVENVDTSENQKVLFVKMLKGTNQRVDLPLWDLMMKNVYRIGGGDINPDEFDLDIFYEDPGKGFKRFLPEDAGIKNVPLLNIFGLDKLNVTGDPQPDGKFDFVNGITINPQLGIVMFPVLEPFGNTLRDTIEKYGGNLKYVYDQLYDSTIVKAREYPELNRFTLKGKAKSSTSSDISLGAFNIPPGSVRVTAGGQQLKENEDYIIDYNIGRIKILNQAYLQPNTPINVSFEDNALFSFNKKTMLGLRADYEVNKHLSLGGTYMHLFERPYTQKVNVGDDPINNHIYGLDLNYSNTAPWLTKLVDKLPLFNTSAPSNIAVQAEMAALSPSHSRAIDKNRKDSEGVVYLDDFEGTTSNFDLRSPATSWVLASTPQHQDIDGGPAFTESALIDNLLYGVNRAHINWYRIDEGVRQESVGANAFPYTRLVNQQEIFRNRTPRLGLNDFRTFDITYLPTERGPYNFELPLGSAYSEGFDINTCKLIDPQSRWGGIMRGLNQVNFEQANIEAIEFWMMDPFIVDTMGGDHGKLVFQLGNVSEDILRDSRKFFEHGMPLSATDAQPDTTNWGRIPRIPATVNAFSNNVDARKLQDIGLDGWNDDQERIAFKPYIDAIQMAGVNQVCLSEAQKDPSGDDFTYFLDESVFPPGTNLFERYHDYNGPEGNSPPPNANANRVNASTNIPDSEDINNDNSLSENESYYEYVVDLTRDPNGSVETGYLNPATNPLITDVVTTPQGAWYRFKIPIDNYTRTVGGINDFRSIRFMRMLMTQWSERTTLRFATLDLVRNQWRRVTRNTGCEGTANLNEFVIDAVNIEENSDRIPFRYDIPFGIQRERITSSTYQDIYQNEQSLSLKYIDLADGCNRAVYKDLDLDLRVFKNVQMFVHSEELDSINHPIPNGAVQLFMRFGSDFSNNYYEYELPLVQSKDPNLIGDAYKHELWKDENEVQFSLEDLTNLKIERNESGADPTLPYSKIVTQVIEGVSVQRKFTIVGNPTLGYVKEVVIGIRNQATDDLTGPYSGEIWVNELRVVGLDEKGGIAGLARMDATLADLGTVGVAGQFSSIGYGAIDQKLDQRAKESVRQLDVSTSLQLGKFFGKNSSLSIPFYYQFSQNIRKPKYDALDLDLLLKDKLARTTDQHAHDSIKEISQDYTSLRQISFTNIRKEAAGGGSPKPWDISNFSLSYANTRALHINEVLEKDELKQNRGSLDYAFTLQPKPIQPFQNLSKSGWLKWLTDFNFNPVPSSFTFSTIMDRKFGERDYRFSDPIFKTWYDKRFTWDRTYSFRWDLAKSLKFTYNGINNGVVDEPNEYVNRIQGIKIEPKVRNDSIWQNIKSFGRTKDYTHQVRLTYTVPFKSIPMLDWVQTNLTYDASYGWKAASINTDSLGNVIQNGQTKQASGELDFTKLYNKSPFLAKVNKPNAPSRSSGGPKAAVPKNAPNPKDNKNKDANNPNNPNNTKNNTNPPDSLAGKDQDKTAKDISKKMKKDKAKEDKAKEAKKPAAGVSPALKAIIRPLLLVRKFRLNYGEIGSTTIPGFTPTSHVLGMDRGFDAPGWDFIAGIQPKINRRVEQDSGDWLANARSNNWITTNPFQNNPVLQTASKSVDSRLTLEPFNDFKIDVDFSRNLTQNFSEFFKTYHKTDSLSSQIGRMSPRDIGTFSISWLSIPTLFKDDSLQINDLFKQFESYRSTVSNERGNGNLDHPLDGPDYDYGFGRKQQDILIPAFLSAYTGKDPKNFNFNEMFNWLPRPNWQLNYNGLSKLPMFKNLFSNVRISHGYKSTLTINSFESDLNYDDYNSTTGEINQQTPENLDTLTQNYYSQFLLPTIIMEEQFSPLVGIDVKFKNDMNLSFSYAKKRSLTMGFVSYELAETRSTTMDIGFDWKLKDVRIGFLPGFNSQANKKKVSSKKPGEQKLGNDLSILFDLSFADNFTINHYLDQNAGARPTRGSKDISISPSISYDINKNVNLRFFVDYRRQQPYVSNSYLVINTNGGLTVRVKLE